MASIPYTPGGNIGLRDSDQHSDCFGHGSARQDSFSYVDYLATALGSKPRLTEQHMTGRPDRPNTLDSLSYFHRSGPSETKQQYGQATHPPTQGVHALQVPSNFPLLPKHSPVQVSQHTYLGSDHSVFAPGYPWPVEEQIGNHMHPIQPQLAQRFNLADCKNPKKLKIFTPVSNEFLSHDPVGSRKSPGLGLHDSYSSPNHPNIDFFRTTDPSKADQHHLLPRGTTGNIIDLNMNYPYLYSPACYYTNERAAYPPIVAESPYACYSPYQCNFPLSPEYVPSTYHPATSSALPQQKSIVKDEDFYLLISQVYKSADEPELDRLLSEKTGSILTTDPFSNKIGIDFGYGPLPSLAEYQIDRTGIGYYDAFNIDDLYLLEKALRLDELLTDKERLRRWDQRLDWENSDNKTKLWGGMSAIDRSRIGIDLGSWWTYRLFGNPFNTMYGYYRTLLGLGGMFSRCGAFRKGTIPAHYPLTGRVKSKFPMWRDGGLGLGRSLIAWLDDRPESPSSGQSNAKSKEASEDQKRNLELQKRWFRAQCNRSNLINTIMQTSTVMPPRIPQAYYTAPGHPTQPTYMHPKVFEPARFDHRIYEPVAGRSPGNFHIGIPPQGFPNQTMRPQPLQRSVSFTSFGHGGTHAQCTANHIDPANLYRGTSINSTIGKSQIFPQRPIPVPNQANSKDSTQNPSNRRPTSRVEATRPEPKKSHRHEPGPTATPKYSAPQNSHQESSSNRNMTALGSTSISPSSGLPKPPQIYTPQMIANGVNGFQSGMESQS